jgi:hypothetical protein
MRNAVVSADERRSARANVLLTAIVAHGPTRIPVRISNLSEHGALVIGRGLPASEARVTFHCNGVDVEGFVAWSSQGRAGIQFETAIQPKTLTQRAPPCAGPIVKADSNADFRRPGFRGKQMTDEESRIVAQWNQPEPKRTG